MLYNNNKKDSFYDRLIILFFHLSFLLKMYKQIETKKNLQNFFDFCIRQIELSIREIGYGDATINKKMKEYVNLLFSIIDKIDQWETLSTEKRKEIILFYVDSSYNSEEYVVYFEKYRNFLAKNSFKNLSKDILTF